jgi:hypothetical protein
MQLKLPETKNIMSLKASEFKQRSINTGKIITQLGKSQVKKLSGNNINYLKNRVTHEKSYFRYFVLSKRQGIAMNIKTLKMKTIKSRNPEEVQNELAMVRKTIVTLSLTLIVALIVFSILITTMFG